MLVKLSTACEGSRGRGATLVASAEAKYSKLTSKSFAAIAKYLTAKKAQFTSKRVKQNVRNQFRKPKKCELRQFYFPKTNYPLQTNMRTK